MGISGLWVGRYQHKTFNWKHVLSAGGVVGAVGAGERIPDLIERRWWLANFNLRGGSIRLRGGAAVSLAGANRGRASGTACRGPIALPGDGPIVPLIKEDADADANSDADAGTAPLRRSARRHGPRHTPTPRCGTHAYIPIPIQRRLRPTPAKIQYSYFYLIFLVKNL